MGVRVGCGLMGSQQYHVALNKKKGGKKPTSYWDRSVKVQPISCEIILLLCSAGARPQLGDHFQPGAVHLRTAVGHLQGGEEQG